jgi:putative transposase
MRLSKGGVSKLTKEQQQKLRRFLDRGALRCGFPADRWTLVRVAELIEREFGVSYHPNYLDRLLDRLGYIAQKPLPRAAEQERELVQAWLDHNLPKIKNVAAIACVLLSAVFG